MGNDCVRAGDEMEHYDFTRQKKLKDLGKKDYREKINYPKIYRGNPDDSRNDPYQLPTHKDKRRAKLQKILNESSIYVIPMGINKAYYNEDPYEFSRHHTRMFHTIDYDKMGKSVLSRPEKKSILYSRGKEPDSSGGDGKYQTFESRQNYGLRRMKKREKLTSFSKGEPEESGGVEKGYSNPYTSGQPTEPKDAQKSVQKPVDPDTVKIEQNGTIDFSSRHPKYSNLLETMKKDEKHAPTAPTRYIPEMHPYSVNAVKTLRLLRKRELKFPETESTYMGAYERMIEPGGLTLAEEQRLSKTTFQGGSGGIRGNRGGINRVSRQLAMFKKPKNIKKGNNRADYFEDDNSSIDADPGNRDIRKKIYDTIEDSRNLGDDQEGEYDGYGGYGIRRKNEPFVNERVLRREVSGADQADRLASRLKKSHVRLNRRQQVSNVRFKFKDQNQSQFEADSEFESENEDYYVDKVQRSQNKPQNNPYGLNEYRNRENDQNYQNGSYGGRNEHSGYPNDTRSFHESDYPDMTLRASRNPMQEGAYATLKNRRNKPTYAGYTPPGTAGNSNNAPNSQNRPNGARNGYKTDADYYFKNLPILGPFLFPVEEDGSARPNYKLDKRHGPQRDYVGGGLVDKAIYDQIDDNDDSELKDVIRGERNEQNYDTAKLYAELSGPATRRYPKSKKGINVGYGIRRNREGDTMGTKLQRTIDDLENQTKTFQTGSESHNPVYTEIGSLTYKGQFMHGLKHGFGHETTDSGSGYLGFWFRDKKEGLGRVVLANGDYYQGYFKNDKCHGRGVFFKAENGVVYVGDFFENVCQGEGKEYYGFAYMDVEVEGSDSPIFVRNE